MIAGEPSLISDPVRRAMAAVIAALLVALSTLPTNAQEPAESVGTRAAEIAAQQAEKATHVTPYKPGLVEAFVKTVDEHLAQREVKWHPFYGTAYHGAGLTAGVGYMFHTGDYDTLDIRGSMSLSQSKRVEIEYIMPRLLGRRGVLTVLGGWREGLGQDFFGLGTAHTSIDDRTDFNFRSSYGAATLDVHPARGMLKFGGGVEVSRFEERAKTGSEFAQRYTPETLPGRGATVDYVQIHGTAALDSRPRQGYAVRGGYYGVTARNYLDPDKAFSFRQVDYEVVQHVPIYRDAWVLSLRGRAETTFTGKDNDVPFFLQPFLGNASTLRAYSGMRFRERNSLLLSAEWRVLVNSFVDTALFYDAGKVTRRRADLNLDGLKSGYGIGFRFHTPAATPVRLDFARGNEGFLVAFAASAAF
jgi:hypothetical protein